MSPPSIRNQSTRQSRGGTKFLSVAIATAWLASIAVGFGILLRYSAASGDAAGAPERWPLESGLQRADGICTLVLFAHPRCPCTRSSLEQLDRIAARELPLQVEVVFFVPEDQAEAWAHTDLWETAAAIPGVGVRADPGGKEAQRFGARTSGQALVYDPSGGLRLQGGLTPARGHVGDSVLEAQLVDLVRGNPVVGVAPVFGCRLLDSPDSPAVSDVRDLPIEPQ
ncbi:MAG: RedB protein [Planctomycetes bacterium]|nr:RedB protein [Planctomycetota bacterium]